MIKIYNVTKFCKEDPSLIENYDKAIADKSQTWHCHHKLETQLNLSRTELIKQGKYYNRPAAELIFLTREEHAKIHMRGENSPMHGRRGEKHPRYGHSCTEYMTVEAYNIMCKKLSEYRKGKSPGNKGKHRVYDENGKCHYE